MRIIINDKIKKDLFIAIAQTLKGSTTLVNLIFNADHLYIQGMDKSHVCLFDVHIKASWFNEYEKNAEECDIATICIDTNTFHSILATCKDEHDICLHYKGDAESFFIDLTIKDLYKGKGDFSTFFKIPLADMDHELLNIPVTDYDAEFSMNSKKIVEIANKMLLFGDTIHFVCSEEKIDLIANGVAGEMIVNIPIEDLNEYSIAEGEIVKTGYSLNYISKMCFTTKLSTNIDLFISGEFPMKIKYDLGEGSHFIFYIAPKIEEDHL